MSADKKETLVLNNQKDMINEFFKILSVAHMCDVENKNDGTAFYNGPSPDEVALVEFAQSQKYECIKASENQMTLKRQADITHVEEESGDDDGEPQAIPPKYYDETYEVFKKIDFNSDRKRMSILVRDPNDKKIKMFIKGADSIIKDRLDYS